MTAKVASNWHPLTMLSHTLDCQLYGLAPAGHHATSLLLHLANVLLLFEVLRRMTGAVGRSAAVAALFAVHPTHVESVAWIAERKDVLSALFWILAMGAWARYARQPSAGRYGLVALLMILGLMAKPMVVTLPFALLLLDLWPLGRRPLGWKRLILEKLPLLALSAVSSVITIRYQEASLAPLDVVPWSLRAANALVAYAAYLGKLFWPTHLAVFYPIPLAIPAWKVLGAALPLIAITALALWRARREPWLLIGWLWFLGTLVPVIGLVQVGRQAMADRYLYLPSVGLFLVIVWALAELLKERRAALATAAGLVILLLAAITWVQIGYWADSVTLFRHALAATDDGNYLAHIGLGKALQGEKDCGGAEEQFRAVLARYPYQRDARAGLEAVRQMEREGSCSTRSSTPR